MNNQAQQPTAQFQIHKLYLKDLSYQMPSGLESFRSNWAPELNVELQTQSKPLAEKDTHEVILSAKCTVSTGGKVAFIIEVQQAGIFTISNIEGENMRQALGIFCPNLLYPYLRETVSSMVTKGGFPQLSLAPINFETLYHQQQQQNATKQ
jgi:preprotein translocase subunit SecB